MHMEFKKIKIYFVIIVVFSSILNQLAYTMNLEEKEEVPTSRVLAINSLQDDTEKSNLMKEEDIVISNHLSYTNPLSSYLSKVISQDDTLFQHKNLKIFQIIKGTAGIIGSTTGLPFISTSLKAGKEINAEYLGWMIAGACTLTYGGTAAWTMTELVDNFNQKTHEEEKILKYNKYQSYAKHIACNLLGALASTPTVYLAYYYNDFKPLAILTFLGSYSLKSLGYYKLLDQLPSSLLRKGLQKSSALSRTEQDYFILESIPTFKLSKDQITNMINRMQLRFLKMSDEERELTFERLRTFPNLKEAYEFLSFEENQGIQEKLLSPELWKNGHPRKAVLALSTIFPIASAFVNIVASYRGAKTIYDNEIFAGSAVISSIIPSLALDIYVTRIVAGNIYNSIYNIYNRRNTPDLMTFLYPKAKYIIPAIALTITVLSLGNDTFITIDILKDSVFSQLTWPLTSLLVASNVQFETYAMTDLLYNISINLLSIFDKPKKKLINFIRHLNIFSYFTLHSDEEIISDFSKDIIDKDI